MGEQPELAWLLILSVTLGFAADDCLPGGMSVSRAARCCPYLMANPIGNGTGAQGGIFRPFSMHTF